MILAQLSTLVHGVEECALQLCLFGCVTGHETVQLSVLVLQETSISWILQCSKGAAAHVNHIQHDNSKCM